MKKNRDIFLHDIPLDSAWDQLVKVLSAAGRWNPFPGEEIPLTEALGRTTAQPIWAKLSAPHYHASAMDGFAVRAKDTTGATETRPLCLQLIGLEDEPMGDTAPALPVNTGHPLPAWADAVIMVENVQLLDESGKPTSSLDAPATGIEIRASVAPWQHVRPMGEDMVATELVLPANHTLRPVDLGAIAGAGYNRVLVRTKPRVAIIPTGSELVAIDSEKALFPGDIIEYNSVVMAAQVTSWGGEPTRWPIVPDDMEAIRLAVIDAARTHDLVLVNAGSSAGTEDYTAAVVSSLGQLLVHGVAIRPGHPVVLGTVKGEGGEGETHTMTPIIGVPGYPVSAVLTGELFVEPLLSNWLGRPPSEPLTLQAIMSRQVYSTVGDDEYLRVTVGRVGERVITTPLGRGAGTISTLVRADGIVKIPRFTEGVSAGEKVTVRLYRTPQAIQNTIVAIGSHDLTLDLLAQYLAERAPGMRLTSANVGSLGGLTALRRGEAHLAGSHLLDPETGEYNVRYVKRYLADREGVMVTLIEREQGFIIPSGNPHGLSNWEDLRRTDLRFVNRQRGAGTRILLDYELSRRGINPDNVMGYERQEYTHLAVAAAVASKAADFGLGIRAAATALELDFVSLAKERYDLIIPREHFNNRLLKPLLALLWDEEFRMAVAEMPGYDVKMMGREIPFSVTTTPSRLHA